MSSLFISPWFPPFLTLWPFRLPPLPTRLLRAARQAKPLQLRPLNRRQLRQRQQNRRRSEPRLIKSRTPPSLRKERHLRPTRTRRAPPRRRLVPRPALRDTRLPLRNLRKQLKQQVNQKRFLRTCVHAWLMLVFFFFRRRDPNVGAPSIDLHRRAVVHSIRALGPFRFQRGHIHRVQWCRDHDRRRWKKARGGGFFPLRRFSRQQRSLSPL